MKKTKDSIRKPEAVALEDAALNEVAGGDGGGIHNTSDLTLTDSTLSGNRTAGGDGDGTPDIIVGAGPGGGPHVR